MLVSHDLSQSGGPRVVVELARLLVNDGFEVVVVSPLVGPLVDSLVSAGAIVAIDPHLLEDDSRALRVLAPLASIAICNTVVTRRCVRALHATVPTIWYLHEVSLIEDWLRVDAALGDDFAVPWKLWCGSAITAKLVRRWRDDAEVVPYGLVPLVVHLSEGLDVDAHLAARGHDDDRSRHQRDLGTVPTTEGATGDLVRIAVFGSIELRKGQDLAIEAIHALDATVRSRVHLTIYGRILFPDFKRQLEASIGGAPVSFGGELDPTAYRIAMLQTDIVLVSSRDDTLPLVSLDALGARRVLACTPTTGTADYIEEGVSGFVSKEVTARSIAEMLGRAIAARDRWKDIGEHAARIFETNFSCERFSKFVLDSVAEKPGVQR